MKRKPKPAMERKPKPGELWQYRNITSELYKLYVLILGEPFLPFGCRGDDELRVKIFVIGWCDDRPWPYWLNKIEREYIKNLKPVRVFNENQ